MDVISVTGGIGAIVLSVLYNLFVFSVGVSEAVFVSKYDMYKDECNSIWGWIVAACVIDLAIPVFSCCGLASASQKEEKKKKNTLTINLLHIGSIIIAIWSAVTYYNISTSCKSFWTSDAPELWTFVMIHFVLLWISVGLIASICLLCCCAVVISGISGIKTSSTDAAV